MLENFRANVLKSEGLEEKMEAPQYCLVEHGGLTRSKEGGGLAFPFFCFQYTSGFYKYMVSIYWVYRRSQIWEYWFNDVYLTAHGLRKYGNKSDKMKTIGCQVLQKKNDAIKEKQRDMTASMSDTDEQDEESDRERLCDRYIRQWQWMRKVEGFV